MNLLFPKRFSFFFNSRVLRVVKCPVLKNTNLNPLLKTKAMVGFAPSMIKSSNFYTWPILLSESATEENESKEEGESDEKNKKLGADPSKDRTRVIPPEVSIRYLKSEAYKTAYGDEPVWVKYRRNFKGQFTPRNSRKTCIRGGFISTGNPCPICRDEYLVLHYTNVDLLKQFIRPETGQIYSTRKTHICQKRLLQLEVAVMKAKFYGLLTYEVPFRKFNYNEYYPQK